MVDFTNVKWVSFDCYGTLVDWETGISSAVSSVLESHDVHHSAAQILELFAEMEPQAQSSPGYRDYRSVLRQVMELIGSRLGLQFGEDELTCLADTLPRWPIFPDAPAALHAMQGRYKLAIISNVDDDLFAGSARALGVEIDAVVTSEQAGCYKPNLRNFEIAKERMAVDNEGWLHVGESLYHDIGPANRLGITSVWVSRAERGGGTRPTDAVPDLVVADLAALAELIVPS